MDTTPLFDQIRLDMTPDQKVWAVFNEAVAQGVRLRTGAEAKAIVVEVCRELRRRDRFGPGPAAFQMAA